MQVWVEGGTRSFVLANVNFETRSEIKVEIPGRPLTVSLELMGDDQSRDVHFSQQHRDGILSYEPRT